MTGYHHSRYDLKLVNNPKTIDEYVWQCPCEMELFQGDWLYRITKVNDSLVLLGQSAINAPIEFLGKFDNLQTAVQKILNG